MVFTQSHTKPHDYAGHIGSDEHCRNCAGLGEHAEVRNTWGDTAGASICAMCGGTRRQTVLIGIAAPLPDAPRRSDFDEYLFPVGAAA